MARALVWTSLAAVLLAACQGPTKTASRAPEPDVARPPPAAEAPITATTPQAAAAVVRRYYALLAAGRTAEAARLRSDGATPAPSPAGAGGRVEVGAPGPMEGAAGSIYIEIPITLHRPGAAGPPEPGKVALRRVNNVPGASADQLRWRIARIELAAPGDPD